MSGSGLNSDLRQVIYALSSALDLVGIDDVAHGKRVGIMAAECAQFMGMEDKETTFLFDLGMLHDIGVSSTQMHHHLLNQFDWESSQDHAETGYQLLRDFVPLARMAVPILYHHTRWEKLPPLSSKEITPEQARQANLIFMVDRVDALAARWYGNSGTLLDHADAIRERIRSVAGTYFDPELVAAFDEASQAEAFWLLLEPRSIQSYLMDMMAQGESYSPSFSELRQLATIFSRIVDAKSPFTTEHSMGVAGLARLLAERMGVSKNNCDKLELAGLLHDLGKLRVPDEVLDKPGKLDAYERRIINTHSFETYQILHKVKGFEEIALWAGYHHEKPDGKGYPFRKREDQLPLEARILRIADMFQSMVQTRPYRAGMEAHDALAFVKSLVANEKTDREILGVIAANLPEATAAALQPGRLSLISPA